MSIEKLTEEEREQLQVFREWRHVPAAKALRIIDQLTAALEAADKNARHCVECVVQAESVSDAAEARAEALQARVAELEAEVAIAWDDDAETKRANAAETELADLRGRVGRAITWGTSHARACGDYSLLEILRGR